MRTILNAALLCLGLLCWTGASAQAPLWPDNTESIAVVVGNKSYKQTSSVDFAHNDAEAIKAWLTGTLGFREQNVFLLKDATLGELTQMFGSEANPQGAQLWRRAVEGRSNVFVYYSGHGVPDLATRQPFLLPQDGNPNSSESGYALQTLYRNLELVRQKIGAQRQLIVMIDACFTGETGRKGESLLAVSAPGFTPAKPRVGSGIIKLVATSGTTPANWDQEAKLGLFTSRFLMGAAGLARPAGVPETGPLAWSDLQRYLKDSVEAAARRDSGREQAPEIDEVSLSLPIGQPVPAVADLVAAAQDEAAWQRILVTKERAALEDYVASCTAPCRHREEALGYLRGQQRSSEAAADRQNWQRLSAAGNYADYLKGCGAVCAYRALAEDYLQRSPGENDRLARRCDELTANPDDQDRSPDVAPVAFKDIRADEAIAACRAAVEMQPQSRRLSFQLGRAYDKAARYGEALSAYRKAADAGSAIAMNNLGYLLENGEGGPKNFAEARRWYEKSALAGNAAGMNRIAVMLDTGRAGPKNQPQARHWFEKAARAGNPTAMYNLGNMLDNGEGGPRNLPEARIWFEKAALAGEAEAMNNFGYMLDNGRGGPAELAEARRWFEKAALAGDVDAMNNLGNSLEHGRGGPRNLAEARRWYQKAAQAGNAAGKNNLRRLQQKPKAGP